LSSARAELRAVLREYAVSREFAARVHATVEAPLKIDVKPSKPKEIEAPTRPATIMSSIRKLEANKRNASRSTGPRTPGGKLRLCHNALRHGLASRIADDPVKK
jgi:hypothetical protein